MHMGVEIWFQAFLTPTVDGLEWSVSLQGPLPQNKELAVHTE